MTNPVFSLVLLALLAVANLAALSAARSLVAGAFHIADVGFFFDSGPRTTLQGISRWARPAILAACLAVTYAIPAALFAVAHLLGGNVTAVPSTTVHVLEDRPAAAAGLRDGDRITSLAGHSIATWDELSGAVAAHPGEAVDVGVERAGAELHLTVTPGARGTPGQGKIGVAAVSLPVHYSAGQALRRGLGMPVEVLWTIAKTFVGYLGGSAEGTVVSGPVAIVRESSRAAAQGPGDFLAFAAALNTYFWPGLLFVALATMPRSRVITAGKKRV